MPKTEHKIYDKSFLNDTLYLLHEQLHDLDLWSVYNKDKYSDEICEIKKSFKELTKKIGIKKL
jgi:hypothetical protein